MQTRLIRMSNPKEPSAGDDSKATS
jgi:hypothetical protein